MGGPAAADEPFPPRLRPLDAILPPLDQKRSPPPTTLTCRGGRETLTLWLYFENGDCRAHPTADNELGASQETGAKQSNKLKNSCGEWN
jgi:hypothetical protein